MRFSLSYTFLFVIFCVLSLTGTAFFLFFTQIHKQDLISFETYLKERKQLQENSALKIEKNHDIFLLPQGGFLFTQNLTGVLNRHDKDHKYHLDIHSGKALLVDNFQSNQMSKIVMNNIDIISRGSTIAISYTNNILHVFVLQGEIEIITPEQQYYFGAGDAITINNRYLKPIYQELSHIYDLDIETRAWYEHLFQQYLDYQQQQWKEFISKLPQPTISSSSLSPFLLYSSFSNSFLEIYEQNMLHNISLSIQGNDKKLTYDTKKVESIIFPLLLSYQPHEDPTLMNFLKDEPFIIPSYANSPTDSWRFLFLQIHYYSLHNIEYTEKLLEYLFQNMQQQKFENIILSERGWRNIRNILLERDLRFIPWIKNIEALWDKKTPNWRSRNTYDQFTTERRKKREEEIEKILLEAAQKKQNIIDLLSEDTLEEFIFQIKPSKISDEVKSDIFPEVEKISSEIKILPSVE
jgi:hypothetical protein